MSWFTKLFSNTGQHDTRQQRPAMHIIRNYLRRDLADKAKSILSRSGIDARVRVDEFSQILLEAPYAEAQRASDILMNDNL